MAIKTKNASLPNITRWSDPENLVFWAEHTNDKRSIVDDWKSTSILKFCHFVIPDQFSSGRSVSGLLSSIGLQTVYRLAASFDRGRSNTQELGGYPLQHTSPKVQGIDRAKFGMIVRYVIKRNTKDSGWINIELHVIKTIAFSSLSKLLHCMVWCDECTLPRFFFRTISRP